MEDKKIDQLVNDVLDRIKESEAEAKSTENEKIENNSKTEGGESKMNLASEVTEFVGTAIGNTIGLVIANVDPELRKLMGLDEDLRSIGIFGGRTGAGPQIYAADEAVKASNTEIVKIELPRDTEGGAGHGSLIIFGAKEVSDARRAVQVALDDLNRTFGDVYANQAGHLEFQYTARASKALNKAFGAPEGKAFGITVGAPAGIGVIMADVAVKAATVDVVGYASPSDGTSFTNEVILQFSGDSGAVRQAIIAAREVGIKLLGSLGDKPESTTKPYI
ncbi:propanediol utilization microcompartment protein PduB [Halanaerobium congolense]|jgi:microcompartment protein PduB|uniref:Microcompartment protein PduB n=1 Tax=Halanaerobium congolense TaxID=54121 RepID=A0A1G6L3W2_9FIRM|nr:propanediol utilization microcompartment protein PduB [Halanaerobium congolense]KXS48040.1 MAG: microcompartments protein [Halanaerobium sp. T82-1]OEG62935.1 MAG: microcompartment protein PduB [Halanaerobium sp. MDAL1]PUU86712.1 MAG: microcompartments protein [Halanaerobium sp.]PXV64794.1 microcompartment protein PduB [Halanaerobium congolense]TDP14368.1 microcompartment protein PduB [Halanaerobium congolense]